MAYLLQKSRGTKKRTMNDYICYQSVGMLRLIAIIATCRIVAEGEA